jgi:hypothetical protein
VTLKENQSMMMLCADKTSVKSDKTSPKTDKVTPKSDKTSPSRRKREKTTCFIRVLGENKYEVG